MTFHAHIREEVMPTKDSLLLQIVEFTPRGKMGII